MNRTTSINRVVIAMTAYATIALSLSQCKDPTPIGTPSGSGGNGGGAGARSSLDDASAGGQTSDKDAAYYFINLDVLPPDLPIYNQDVPPPTADANCGITTNETKRPQVDVLLVLDRSLSMNYSLEEDCYCSGAGATATPGAGCKNTTTCSTRWDAIKSAMTTTLASTNYVNWGLKFFSESDTVNCIVTADTEVEIAQDSGDPVAFSKAQAQARTDVQKKINDATQSLSTPTTAALNAATSYLKKLTDSNKKIILLATDGEPNCGGTPANINTTDDLGASDAAAAAKAAGFPVYAIGIGPKVSSLTQVAQKGGTTDYYPATSPDQLAAALSSISQLVGACTFTTDNAPTDPDNVAVYVNKEQVPKDAPNGWKYGATNQEIDLTGTYCDQMSSGDEATVQILFGCEGSKTFPTIIK
jgi:hypothetical protein